jgi:hypothetical protein
MSNVSTPTPQCRSTGAISTVNVARLGTLVGLVDEINNANIERFPLDVESPVDVRVNDAPPRATQDSPERVVNGRGERSLGNPGATEIPPCLAGKKTSRLN